MRDKIRFAGRVAIVNAAIAAVITVAFADVTFHTPWRDALEQFVIAFFFTCCISPLCIFVLPRIAPPVFSRFTFPVDWLIVIGVMLFLAAGGSLFALAVLALIGYLKPNEIFIAWFGSSLRVSVIVTLTLGIFMTAREILRNRLKKATIALRTKERDEAEARRIATEAQLASLESRVQPHFLFNTLNSIAALIPQDPVGAERMTGQLASLLRSSLDSAAKPLVPLEQELKIVADYLDIERVRFGDRLRYEIHVEPGLEQSAVPPLSLQTLVENSVKYAVSPSRSGAIIRVCAARKDGRLDLAVEDDGPGFESDAEPPGHGLALLRERLRMTCGESATLAVARKRGATVVRIQVPVSVADPEFRIT
jgi:two-component system, LytTR family, sensor histidine kinase AlgZ